MIIFEAVALEEFIVLLYFVLLLGSYDDDVRSILVDEEEMFIFEEG